MNKPLACNGLVHLIMAVLLLGEKLLLPFIEKCALLCYVRRVIVNYPVNWTDRVLRD